MFCVWKNAIMNILFKTIIMTRGELEKLNEIFNIAYTGKVYNELEALVLERNINDISELKVTAGSSVLYLDLELVDKELLKDLLLRYVETVKSKKSEAEDAFEQLVVNIPEHVKRKFGKPSNVPSRF